MRFIISFLRTLPFVICLNIGCACVAIIYSISRTAPITSAMAILMILGLVFVSMHAVVLVGLSARQEPLNEGGNLSVNSLTYGVGSCLVLVFPASFLLWLPAMPVALEYLQVLDLSGRFLFVSAVWLVACLGGWYTVVRKFHVL